MKKEIVKYKKFFEAKISEGGELGNSIFYKLFKFIGISKV